MGVEVPRGRLYHGKIKSFRPVHLPKENESAGIAEIKVLLVWKVRGLVNALLRGLWKLVPRASLYLPASAPAPGCSLQEALSSVLLWAGRGTGFLGFQDGSLRLYSRSRNKKTCLRLRYEKAK